MKRMDAAEISDFFSVSQYSIESQDIHPGSVPLDLTGVWSGRV
jgi:hypothetical protein